MSQQTQPAVQGRPSIVRRPRILAVDDDPNIRSLLQVALSPEYDVKTWHTGEAIVEQLDDFHPDIVIMDVMMPALNGFQATEMIRQDKAYAEMPVLFLTARGDSAGFLEGMRAGGDGYIVKPFSLEDLFKRVKTLLKESGALKGS